MASPTTRDVHTPTADVEEVQKPWTLDNPPPPAKNWDAEAKQKCTEAANAVLEDNGTEQEAIFACIRAAGKADKLFKVWDFGPAPANLIQKEMTGAMICFYIPTDTAERISVPGGIKPEYLHLTLAYMGEANQVQDVGRLAHVLESYAKSHPPIQSEVGGVGQSNTSQDGETVPFYATISAPQLPAFRQQLVDILEEEGWSIPNEFGYNPHITLKYVRLGGRQPVKQLPKEKMLFDKLTLKLGDTRLDFPMGDRINMAPMIKQDTYKPPEAARNNARRVLRWREEHPNEIKGMTRVGWTRANQLASGENISRETVSRMAQFNRHRQNAKVAPEHKNTPWKDAGYVAWLGWGGTSGIEWAKRIMERQKMNKQYQVNGYPVLLSDLAQAWLSKAEKFTSVSWSDPQSDLSASDYAKVSLIDLNEPGEEKVKSKIKLPIRSTPGGPINTNALQAVAAALSGARGGINAPMEAKRKAARTVVRLMRQADMEVGSDKLLGLAGETSKAMIVGIVAKAEEKQVAYGVILRPDVPDSDGDIYTPDEVEKAAHNYMAKAAGVADWLHEEEIPRDKAVMVESFIAPVDFDWEGFEVKKGDWLGGMKIYDPDMWGAVKKGEIKAFSIKGIGKRTEL